tara:strand:- start:34 stop:1038 length:1005 start_codon:yes stop_codon:yes gene_type:complete
MSLDILNSYLYLPKNKITNSNLKRNNPSWKVDKLFLHTGVKTRHYANRNETALDLAYKACLIAKKKNNAFFKKIDGLIFCTQTQDHFLPSNSSILHGILNLKENIFTLDVNHGCSGFIYCLSIANSLIESKVCKNILIINADTYSKFINKNDRSTKLLFSDAATATLVCKSKKSKKFKCLFGSSGKNYKKLIIPAGFSRLRLSPSTKKIQIDKSGNKKNLENIHMDGLGILSFVNSKVPEQIKTLLKENNLKDKDIRYYVFHQASAAALKSLKNIMSLKAQKVPIQLETGNYVSASIPAILSDLYKKKKIKKNDKLVLSGFGVGLSWASAIYTV